MIHAYGEHYIEHAQRTLAEAMRYAVDDRGEDPDEFAADFLYSGIAALFEGGDVRCTAGMSGPELIREIIWRIEEEDIEISDSISPVKTPAYWAGGSIAYVQWYLNVTFRDLFQVVSASDWIGLYQPYHEMDLLQLVDYYQLCRHEAQRDTRLKQLRTAAGLSQRELAEASAVSVRMLQQYEQRVKDINRAQTGTLQRVARALYCSIEDLLEAETA